MNKYDASTLVSFADALLERTGLESSKAQIVAETLVNADLIGHPVHGIRLLARYLTELKEGQITTTGQPEILHDAGSVVTWNGNYLPGIWLVQKAMELAFERIVVHPVVIISIQRSHHTGCLQTYLEAATQRNLIALIMCSDPGGHTVAPHGGKTAVLSANPIAAGIPTTDQPILLDICMAYTSRGMVDYLHETRQRLPHSWLLDNQGRLSDNPEDFFAQPRGALLPLGGIDAGHKGFGLSLLVEALTSGLSGYGRKDNPHRWGASVFIQLIRPDAFGGLADFANETSFVAGLCREASALPGSSPVRLPGDEARAKRRFYLETGIPIEQSTLQMFAPWAERLHLQMPVPKEIDESKQIPQTQYAGAASRQRKAAVLFGTRRLSSCDPALIVAEIGLNHCGSFQRAVDLFHAAKSSGADAVKLQKKSNKELLTRKAYESPCTLGKNAFAPTLGKHREFLELDFDDYERLREEAVRLGLGFFASVWDTTSIAFMKKLDPPAFKIASANLTDDPVLKALAGTNKPVFISTGMSGLSEIDHAVSLLERLNLSFVLFHCVSMYPTPADQANLGTIPFLAQRYHVPIGYSGHEMETAVAVAARAVGACVIEKHFTLNRDWQGPDHRISLLPEEFASMVRDIRLIESSLDQTRGNMLDQERKMREFLAKSMVAKRTIHSGETLTEEMIACKAPGTGLSPQRLPFVLGRKAICTIGEDEPILESLLE